MEDKNCGLAIASPRSVVGNVRDPPSASDAEVLEADGGHPDGGLQAWKVLIGCFCSFFAALSMMNAIGVYQSWISENQLSHESKGKISWIFGFYNFFSFFFGIFLGPYFDIHGPFSLTTIGVALLLLCHILLSFCRVYWHFFACVGILGSVSTSLLFTAAMGTIQQWFFKKRGFATGLAISGGSVGGIIWPVILSSMLPAIGFGWTMRAVALLMLPLGAMAVLLTRSRTCRKSEGINYWREIAPDLRILLHWRASVLTLGVLLIEIGFFVPVTYIASYARHTGLSTRWAFLVVTILNVGSLLGRWLPGWLGDKVGRFNTQIAALALCLVSIFGIWQHASKSLALQIVFVILFGLGSGSGISLVPVCIGQLCKTEEYGAYFTTIFSVASFGSLFGVPLGGLILESRDGDYLGLILFAGMSYAGALLCFTVVRVMSVGFSFKTKY